MPAPRRRSRVGMEAALAAFIDAINTMGGIAYDQEGMLVPAAAPTWVDLASAYLRACRALGVEPVGEAVRDLFRPLRTYRLPRRRRTRS